MSSVEQEKVSLNTVESILLEHNSSRVETRLASTRPAY